MLRSLLIVLLAGGLWGCSSGAAPASPSSGSPTQAPSTVVASPAATAAATPGASTTVEASDPRLGPVVVTVADGLRVRSLPRVSDDSIEHEPLLPVHTKLFVLDGPVTASGYTWYDVVALGSRTLPSGWVAAASRSGEPWLATAEFACPPVPTDFRALSALPPAVGVACFPRMPITVRARIVDCNCDVDGPTYVPVWFSIGKPRLLVEPDASHQPADVGLWFFLYVDPNGDHPEVLPSSGLVDVTGVFDHPAAAGCTSSGMDEHATPTNDCRLRFAVTRLATVGS